MNQKRQELNKDFIEDKIYTGIVELKNEFPYLNNEEINEKITKMQSNFLDIYNYKKDDDDNGNN